jgi:mono/diheme cytochrome c family protein
MPTKANCVTCHSPQGKVVAECITCHTFHAPPQTTIVDLSQTPPISVKQMMFGRVSALR